MRVLLLVDDRDDRRVYRSLLERGGHVVEAPPASEVLRVASASRFDCLVLGCHGSDGALDLFVDVSASDRVRDEATRVRNVLRAAAPSSARRPLRLGRVVVRRAPRTVTLDGGPVRLTPVQYDVLEQLAVAAGEVVTRQVLIERCWVDAGRTRGTPAVQSQISRLRSRFRGALTIELVRSVDGFRLRAPDQ